MSQSASTHPVHPSQPGRRGSRRGRRLLVGAAATALAAGTLVAIAPSAHAGACDDTGGSSDWVMWTGSGFTCAYQAKSDKKKIGSFNTQTWTHSTALGYTKREYKKKQSGGVDISYMYYDGGSLGSSITFTAFNTEDGSRHWGAAVIWNTAQAGKVSSTQYEGDNYEFDTNRFHVSKISTSGPATTTPGTPVSYTIKVSDPDGGLTPSGTIALMLQPGSEPSPTKKGCDGTVTSQGNDTGIAQGALSGGSGTLTTPALGAGTYRLYAVYAGSVNSSGRPMYCEGPPHDGLTAAQSATWTLTVAEAGAKPVVTAPRATLSRADQTVTPGLEHADGARAGRTLPLAVVDRSFVTGPDGAAAKPMACPSGWVPLQVNVSSPTQVLPERVLTRDGSKRGILAGVVPAGTTVDVQVVCRPAHASALKVGRTVLGTMHDDNLRTARAGSTVLAGRGDDNVRVSTHGSTAFGFAGADRIVVNTTRGAAHGGGGADLLVARRAGAVLLVGGAGADHFVGARGRTLINARDGAGGDHIVCHSPENVVLADAGDQIAGPCTVK